MSGAELWPRLRAALKRETDASSDFDLNPDFRPPAGQKLRSGGVLVAISDTGFEPRLILTKRAAHLKNHPGQIAFAGGRVDPDDDGPVAAAVREANEEIGLPYSLVDVIGTLPVHETVTNFSVTPVVARVTGAFEPTPEPGEVAEVFSVPFSHVADPANFQIQSRRWRGKRRAYYTVPYGPYYIWGATARILYGLARRISL